MRPGKFSESVLKRSVLKQIKTKREEVIRGAGVGEDCAFFSFAKKEGALITTAPIVMDAFENIAPKRKTDFFAASLSLTIKE